VRDLFEAWVERPGEVDGAALLSGVGLRVERHSRADAPQGTIAARLRGDGRVYVASVVRGGSAQRGGIDPGDELLAVAGRRVDGPSLDSALQGKRAGDEIEVLVAREGRTLTRALTLDEPRADKVKVLADPHASAEQRARFTDWLGDPHPVWGAR
jgi:predicted metalloprotease with PDZ domain